MSIVLKKGSSEQQATEFAYASCAYSCVASENQAFKPIVMPLESNRHDRLEFGINLNCRMTMK